MTTAELDMAVKQLHNVGGLYEVLAIYVEADNRPWVSG